MHLVEGRFQFSDTEMSQKPTRAAFLAPMTQLPRHLRRSGFRPGFECRKVAVVLDLSALNRPPDSKSGI